MAYDVTVIGGGLIGGSVAHHIARRGAKVLLLEQGRVGQEASWAGAWTDWQMSLTAWEGLV